MSEETAELKLPKDDDGKTIDPYDSFHYSSKELEKMKYYMNSKDPRRIPFAYQRSAKDRDRFIRKYKNLRNTSPITDEFGRVLIPKDQIKITVIDEYKKPESGLKAPEKMWRHLKTKYIGISLRDVKKALTDVEEYQIFKKVEHQSVTRPVTSKAPFNVWQVDLTMITPERHLLVAKDVHTKKIWVRQLNGAKPNALNTVNAFKDILKEAGQNPKTVQSDQGGEFKGEFGEFLAEQKIHQVFSLSHNPTSQGQVEHVNLTLKRLMERNTAIQGGNKLADIQTLVSNYNNTYHHTIKMTPNEAQRDENREKVNENIDIHVETITGAPKRELKIGDSVRILIESDRSKILGRNQERFVSEELQSSIKRRGYKQQWSRKIFEVVQRKMGRRGIVRAAVSYKIRDPETKQTLPKTYPRFQLQYVDEDELVRLKQKKYEDEDDKKTVEKAIGTKESPFTIDSSSSSSSSSSSDEEEKKPRYKLRPRRKVNYKV